MDPLLESMVPPGQPAGPDEPSSGHETSFPTLDAVCAGHIRKALGRAKGKISGPGGAAEFLGLHPNTLRQRMDRLGIDYRRRRRPKTRA